MNDFERALRFLSENANTSYIPGFVKPVILMEGSYYDMGFQMGQQGREYLIAQAVNNAARIVESGKAERAPRMAAQYLDIVKNQSPELYEMWQGSADGAGVPIMVLVLQILNLFTLPPNRCSSISAWGSATRDGKMYNVANADGGFFTPTSFAPVAVMYAADGTHSINNGGYSTNFAMNNKGLVNMATGGGFEARPQDTGVGTPAIISNMYLNLVCDSVDSCLDKVLNHMAPLSSAENLHLADTSGKAVILETNFSHYAVRRPGDNGETDFLNATNYFLSPEMQSSCPPSDARYKNAVYRWMSEVQLMKEMFGTLDLDQMEKIITCHKFYDGEKWNRESRDIEMGKWSPEKHTFMNETYMQSMGDPNTMTLFIRQGKSEYCSSPMVGATGRFSKLVVKDKPLQLVNQAAADAKKELYKLAERILSGKVIMNEVNVHRQDEARRFIWEGESLKNQALIATDKNTELKLLGAAATNYCKAQTLAQI